MACTYVDLMFDVSSIAAQRDGGILTDWMGLDLLLLAALFIVMSLVWWAYVWVTDGNLL